MDRNKPMMNQEIQRLKVFNSVYGFALLYLFLISLAEMIIAYLDSQVGFVFHAALLTTMIFHSLLVWEKPLYRLSIVLMFAPLIRLVNLSLPLPNFERIYWYLLVSIPLFIVIPMMANLLGLRWRQLGFVLVKSKWELIAILSALAFGALEYLILRPVSFVDSLSLSDALVPAAILLISTGLLEELIFRGLLLQIAQEVMSSWLALLYSALIFTVLHIGYRSFIDLVIVFAAGMFWGFIWLKTRSVIGITIGHGLSNILLFIVIPHLGFVPAPLRPSGAPPETMGISAELVPLLTGTIPSTKDAIYIVLFIALLATLPLLLGSFRYAYQGYKQIRAAMPHQRDGYYVQLNQRRYRFVSHTNMLEAKSYPWFLSSQSALERPIKILLLIRQGNDNARWCIKLDLYDELILGSGTGKKPILNLNLPNVNTAEVAQEHIVLRPSHEGLWLQNLAEGGCTEVNNKALANNESILLEPFNELVLGQDMRLSLKINQNLSSG